LCHRDHQNASGSGDGMSPPKRKKRGHHQPNSPSRPVRFVKALRSVSQGMSIRAAAYAYNIPRSTISGNGKRVQYTTAGRPTELSQKEEAAIVDHLLIQAEWGFPLTRHEVNVAIQYFLDKEGRKSKRFKNNMPGDKWMRSFLNRHPALLCRVPRLISSARSKIFFLVFLLILGWSCKPRLTVVAEMFNFLAISYIVTSRSFAINNRLCLRI